MHARHLAAPDEASPYAPTSREFLDAVYIDVEAVADYAACAETQALLATADFQARLMAARAAPLVDYAAVTALKLQVLLQLFAHFQLVADRGKLHLVHPRIGPNATDDRIVYQRSSSEGLSWSREKVLFTSTSKR